MKKSAGKNILLGVSGSIAAYKACDIITEFRERGHTVSVVMTRDAHHFVTKLSLQSFAGTEVVDDFFSVEGRVKPIHIELAKNADVLVVAPASADVIAKLAHGLADDVLCCSALATEAPLVVAPAMNEKMYTKKVTQENIEKLKKSGAVIVPPVRGHLVCMDMGMGHLAPEAAIVAAVQKALQLA
jgi:phosphopantothenoylcysteine synthetase/decarboxylase